jgi:hypothetical protein
MISYTANARLMKLLPRLAAVTDKHRLKVLSDIDRVLAAEGLTWTDIAAALEPKLEVAPIVLKADAVAATVERIRQSPRVLTDNARDFLAQVNAQVLRLQRAGDTEIGVHLSGRQAAWLEALHSKAEAAEAEVVASKRPMLRLVTVDGGDAA